MSLLKINNISSTTDLEDYRISLYVTFFYVAQAVNAAIKGVFANMGASLWSLTSMLLGGVLFLLLLRSLVCVAKRSPKALGCSLFIFVTLYVISIGMASLRGEPYDVILDIALKNTFLFWLPIGVYAYSIRDKHILYEVMLKASYVISIPWIVYSFYNAQSDEGDTYNMMLGYSLALPCLLHLTDYFRKKKLKSIVFAMVEFFFIVFMSSRGVLVSIMLFGLLYYLFLTTNKGRTKNTLIIAIVAIPLLLSMSSLIEGLNNFMIDQFGIGSRTLTMMMEGNADSQSGRELFRQAGLYMVDQRLLFGWGIGGDYYTMAQLLHGDVNTGITCHNGVIQLMTYFGAPIGIIVSMYFAFMVFRCNRCNDYYAKLIAIIFYCLAVFPSLIYGDGLLEKPGSAIFLYLCFAHFSLSKK